MCDYDRVIILLKLVMTTTTNAACLNNGSMIAGVSCGTAGMPDYDTNRYLSFRRKNTHGIQYG